MPLVLHQNAGQNHDMRVTRVLKMWHSSIFGNESNKQNPIQEEIKGLNLDNACYYSVQNLLSSRLLSKNIKSRIYKTIVLPVILYGCKAWCLTTEEHRMREGV
jgi:hypothetical protein